MQKPTFIIKKKKKRKKKSNNNKLNKMILTFLMYKKTEGIENYIHCIIFNFSICKKTKSPTIFDLFLFLFTDFIKNKWQFLRYT